MKEFLENPPHLPLGLGITKYDFAASIIPVMGQDAIERINSCNTI